MFGQEEFLLCGKSDIFSLRFEREFVRQVSRMAADQGLNYSQLARRAFRTDASPEVKWRQIRNVSKAGKPQRLSLTDACQLAEALGQYFPALCFTVWESLRLREEAAGNRQEGGDGRSPARDEMFG